MAILIIDGPHGEAIEFAQTLRAARIAKGGGALIVLKPGAGKGHEHALPHQVEKLLAGETLPGPGPGPGIEAEGLPWKPNPLVLVPAGNEAVLADIEALVPGFTAKFGPVSRMAPLP